MANNRLVIVVGTRPNFIKITRFREVNSAMGSPFEISIIHTGQHASENMSDVFFRQFDLQPDIFLNVPSGTPNMQTAEIMLRLEEKLEEIQPGLVLVAGDVNSTFAAAFTTHRMGIRLGHIESGLRSFDRSMPEEINRILTDEISDYFFVTEQSGMDNLLREGKNAGNIFFTGNTMIDTLVRFDEQIHANDILNQLKLKRHGYALMTMHRPATVDRKEGLQTLAAVISGLTSALPVVFAVHPRTRKNITAAGLSNHFDNNPRLLITEPLDYFSFQKLIADAAFVITDSGGLQEETTFREIPCITLRPNTERPSTITLGSNELIPLDPDKIQAKVQQILENQFKKGKIPPLWDGHATERILEACKHIMGIA